MSRRGNCHDNAVAESFFQLLKRERVRRKIYLTREQARSDVFDYIEPFYNSRRRHGANGGLAPIEFVSSDCLGSRCLETLVDSAAERSFGGFSYVGRQRRQRHASLGRSTAKLFEERRGRGGVRQSTREVRC